MNFKEWVEWRDIACNESMVSRFINKLNQNIPNFLKQLPSNIKNSIVNMVKAKPKPVDATADYLDRFAGKEYDNLVDKQQNVNKYKQIMKVIKQFFPTVPEKLPYHIESSPERKAKILSLSQEALGLAKSLGFQQAMEELNSLISLLSKEPNEQEQVQNLANMLMNYSSDPEVRTTVARILQELFGSEEFTSNLAGMRLDKRHKKFQDFAAQHGVHPQYLDDYLKLKGTGARKTINRIRRQNNNNNQQEPPAENAA